MKKKHTKIAQQIVEREYARALVKLAIGSMNGIKAPGYSTPTAPAPLKPAAPPKPPGPPTVAGAAMEGLGQGVKNMAGGVHNFVRGGVNAAAGATGLGALTLAHGASAGIDSLLGTKLAPDPEVARAAKQPFADAITAGTSDAVNSFGQYVGVRGAPTAVSDMQAQHRASLPQDTRTPEQRAADINGGSQFIDNLTTPRGAYDAANNVSEFAAGMIPTALVPGAAAGLGAKAMSGVSKLPAAVQPAANAAGNVVKNWSQATGLTLPSNPAGGIVGNVVKPILTQQVVPAAAQTATAAGLLHPALEPIVNPYGAIPTPGPDGVASADPYSALERSLTPEQQQFAQQDPAQFEASYTPEQKQLADTIYAGDQQYPDPVPGQPEQMAQEGEAATPDATGQAAGQTGAQPQQQTGAPPSAAAWAGLPETATPEQHEQVNQAQQQLKSMPAEEQQKAVTAINDPESQEAAELKSKGANNYVAEAAADPNNPPPQDPQGYGSWMNNALAAFDKMDPMAKLAMGVGLTGGLIGLISSVSGGGGIGSFLMAGLGLGGAALMGASSGMFGGDAQGWVNNAFSSIAGALGGNLPNADAIKERLTAAAKQSPEAAQAELAKVRAEVQPYAQFSGDASQFLTDSGDKNYMYNQVQQHTNDNFGQLLDERLKNPKTTPQRIGAALGITGETATTPGTWHSWLVDRAIGAKGSPARGKVIQDQLADKGWVKQQSVNIMRKAARCWAGYEPVPGTKAYTEGSCRPKGSKKTKKEVIQGKNHSEKKAGGPGTGSFTLGSYEKPMKVVYGAPMTPDMVDVMRGILKKHPRYSSGKGLEDPATVHRAALSMMKLKHVPSASGGANDAVRQMHAAGIPGLIGFPAPPVQGGAQPMPQPTQPGRPVPQQMPPPDDPVTSMPRPQLPKPNCPNGRCPLPTTPRQQAPRQTPRPAAPQGRPTMGQMPPQTTSTTAPPRPTAPPQPTHPSLTPNGQYRPSFLAESTGGPPR